ncbi:hypothetical protein O181_116197 [Austropuccinia psidii MF-1]|uniref:Uncharacterized protein n=1 Tax=Austropuccinia psidii MF-1 TaxID=1389203 RepID=A0A9Q3KAY7_9BASI|nr:hypothetical protein [Austropuccinia psidii MF-1]
MPRQWNCRNDEARVRDYKIREARRACAQDRDDAQIEYLTRIRRQESQQEYEVASSVARGLNMPPIPAPSSSGRYMSKPELQAARDSAIQAEAFQRHRATSLQSNLSQARALTGYLTRANQELLEEANTQRNRAALYRAIASRPATRLHTSAIVLPTQAPIVTASYDLSPYDSLFLDSEIERLREELALMYNQR